MINKLGLLCNVKISSGKPLCMMPLDMHITASQHLSTGRKDFRFMEGALI